MPMRAVVALFAVILPAAAAAQSSDAYFEFLMARRLEAQNDYTGALGALERAAAASPMSAEVKAEIASFQLRRNRHAEAEKAARDALGLNDDNIEAHRVIGLVLAANIDAARTSPASAEASAREAIAHLERVVGAPASATDLNLTYTLGRLYTRVGESVKAIDTLTRVVDGNPSSVQARLSLAQAHADAGDIRAAISTLDAIVAEQPRVASALGRYQEQAGLFKEAVESYTRALTIQPMSRELKFRRARALFSAKEYSQSASLAAQAQAQHPNDPRFPRLRARAIFETGAPEQAFAILEPAARAFPRDAATQFALADLYTDAGRNMDAERTLRQLLEVQPANPEALNYLGYLLADSGHQLDEAIRLVQRALDADPDNPSYQDSLGWAYFRRGELDQAEKYLSPAATRLPRNSVIQDHLGDLFAERRRWDDAIAAWARALDGDGDDIDRAAIEKKIKDARSRLNR
jgi:tetratricopeptide (TPR) repeat protein